MKRTAHPPLSHAGLEALALYEHWLREREDLTPASIRNYLSDLRHFIAWYETEREAHIPDCFTPQGITTPALTRYRTYLQTVQRQKPASVNRSLISLKRYFGWVTQQHLIPYDPSAAVKLVGQEESAPRHLDDREEQALVATVTETGNVRDRAIIILMLHTGLRVQEVCSLTRHQVKLGKRSGTITVHGKHNKYREIPSNATARAVLLAYDPSLQKPQSSTSPLFLSEKRQTQLTERGLGYVIKKYVERAKVNDVSPHDLRHRFGYRMAQSVPLHRLAQLMGHDSLDTTMVYVQGTSSDLQRAVETIAWT